MRWRLSRGTARSRTEQRKSPGAAARPREAHVGRTTLGKDEIEGTGGVQRGQTSMGRTRLPLLALFASFSGARKKRQHESPLTNRKTRSKKDNPPCCGGWHSRSRRLPQSACADSSLPEGASVTALRREMPPHGTKSSISISFPTSVNVSGTSPTIMDSAMATCVDASTTRAPVGITSCTCAVS